MTTAPPEDATAAAVVLTKATVRSADMLGLTGAALSRIIGLSESTVDQLAAGSCTLELPSKPAELATLLVRLCMALDGLVGNDAECRKSWMQSDNTAFGAKPRELIETVDGLAFTVRYLDAARALP